MKLCVQNRFFQSNCDKPVHLLSSLPVGRYLRTVYINLSQAEVTIPIKTKHASETHFETNFSGSKSGTVAHNGLRYLSAAKKVLFLGEYHIPTPLLLGDSTPGKKS